MLLGFVGIALLGSTASGQSLDDPYRLSGQSAADTQNSTRSTDPRQNNADRNTDQNPTTTPTDNSGYQPDQISNRSADSTDDRQNDTSRSLQDTTRRSTNAPDVQTLRDGVRRQPPPSEFETFVSTLADQPLRRFGANLLLPTSRDFTAPPTTTVPADYRINPGDELVIGLTGSVQTDNLRLRVDNDGHVFVPRVGSVTVAGVRYADLQTVLAGQISRQYRGFRIAVTIGELHGITVYVTGFAATPGSYTVSSLSTVVNAVLAAGGPSSGGSFRSIQVRRSGRLIADFDLYDLLLHGDRSADVVLQNGDVLYISPVGAQVAVIGSVNNSAIFEARSRDTLNDILMYAGGVNTVADDGRLLVLNPLLGGGWQQISPTQATVQIASRGEVLRVLSGLGIARPLADQPVLVTLSGEVAHPGRFYVPAGTSFSQVLAQAGGLTPAAFPYATVFTRDTVREQQRISYRRALSDTELALTAEPLTSVNQIEATQSSRLQQVQQVIRQLRNREPDGRLILDIDIAATTLPGDMVLQNNDAIYVPPRLRTIGVFGSVVNPATFQYAERNRIRDYLRRAGGPTRIGAHSQIFVVRANGQVIGNHHGIFRGSVLDQPAYPGDLIFVPIDASRGEFWARLAQIASVFGTAALPVAAAISIAQ